MLKDLVYLGLGTALLAKEKVETQMEELVKEGKLAKEDAQNILDKAKVKAEAAETEAKERLKSAIKEVLDELGVATKEDIEALKEKLKS